MSPHNKWSSGVWRNLCDISHDELSHSSASEIISPSGPISVKSMKVFINLRTRPLWIYWSLQKWVITRRHPFSVYCINHQMVGNVISTNTLKWSNPFETWIQCNYLVPRVMKRKSNILNDSKNIRFTYIVCGFYIGV